MANKFHKFTRRKFIGGTFGLTLLGAFKSHPFARERRPNILFIMSDDHANHALSCYGSRIVETPNIDRLAREGMLFRNCFVTNSLCAPSRASILTGKYAHVHGVKDNSTRFDPTQHTFIKLLHRAGYVTAVIGKWHLHSEPTGFDYWCVLPGQGEYVNPTFIEMKKRSKVEGYATDIITKMCISWLRQWSENMGDKPFCLLCHHKAPHRPWTPPQRHMKLYADIEIPEPPTFDDDYSNRASAAAHADMRIADMPDYAKELKPEMTPKERKRYNYQRFIKDYLRCVVAVDEGVGELLRELEQLGVIDDTVIIYTSDNGFFLGDHGWYDKRFMYEQSIRVPLIVRYPREVKAGSTDEHIVLNVDFAPTLLDIAGVEIPGDVQGRSLKSILFGKPVNDWRTAMYYRYYEYPKPHRVLPHYGVRTERYKLIHYPTTGEWELFDLHQDQHEMRNIYGEPTYSGVAMELKELLHRLAGELGDTL
ncbi:MAG: sulfatase [Armatimonadota bacterium]|nr:sulfatase [Armatimonadota bacterium]MCX7777228.1 sulfatase [Armatimonadota bacterium]MDW8024643.1 sulfatase [Armatimonadota bacterium]